MRWAACALAAAGLVALPGFDKGLAAPHAARTTLHVFAAASLAEAFGELAGEFERAHPGMSVQLNLAGSQQLATQIEQGATADIIASADPRWMDHLAEKSLIAGERLVFARNRLVVIVPRTNPAHLGRLQDLARPGVKLVIGAQAVPVGWYSRDVLRNLSRAEGFGPSFARRVLANVVSEEENVKAVVGKVQLGEADAGICYRSDVTRAVSQSVRAITIPDSSNVMATYLAAVVRGAPQSAAGRDFIAFLLSTHGRKILEAHGLIPVSASKP